MGEGDLHPSASLRAAFFFKQALACAKLGPPQLAHFATVCPHLWPFPTPHPSTGHRCSFVVCRPAHHPQRARLVNFPQHRKMPWPSRSPELNPIENVWAMLKRTKKKFRKRCPYNHREVVEVSQEKLEKLPWKRIYDLIGGIPRRLDAVINAEGERTKYQCMVVDG